MVRSLRCVINLNRVTARKPRFLVSAGTLLTSPLLNTYAPRYVLVTTALTAYLPLGLIHRALLTLVDDISEFALILINIYIEVSLNANPRLLV
jgi:hypothetical protein